MDGGEILALLVVAGAAGYLLYYFLRKRRQKGGCSQGCPKDRPKPPAPGTTPNKP